MTEAEYLNENKKHRLVMSVLKDLGVRVYIPGGNSSSEIEYDNSYDWSPNADSDCVTVVHLHSGSQYDYTCKEAAKAMARAVRFETSP